MNEATESGGPAVRTPGDGPGRTPGAVADAADATDGVPADGTDVLPELLELDLETLRTLDHPVLRDLVAELCGRAEQPRETLWGFTNAF
ncbi:FxSxx-COOH cyclophane-containing RiPP peptide [Streptomyces sp. PTD5-9]|uniref:FxSxx-COOH cyclophane-containing RiPP peptide n=1 Tax=Streptomyces sp. PTD5-9 TaxID=3120150 RepID=UPI0030096DF6